MANREVCDMIFVEYKTKKPFLSVDYANTSSVELTGENVYAYGGKGHPKRVDAGVRQVILSHIEEHSKKPDEARERIVRLMGDLPRVELFARQSPEGWDVWGNEVECSITLGKEETVNGICSGPEGS